jgi:hypothetical protein
VVTINTTDDLLRVLSENPEWKAAVRREILTEELLNLPARFDSFVEEQRRISEEQLRFNDRVDRFVVRTDERFARIEGDIANFRSDYARTNAVREADAIAEDMGFSLVRTFSYVELRDMHLGSDTSGIETRLLRSFRRADLVMEVTDEDGAAHYVAVEVSYTADDRDTGRTIRNADFLARFTGRPAHAAVASVRNTEQVQSAVARGEVYWHRLDDRDPVTE